MSATPPKLDARVPLAPVTLTAHDAHALAVLDALVMADEAMQQREALLGTLESPGAETVLELDRLVAEREAKLDELLADGTRGGR